MLYREMMAVCSEIHTKHIQNVKLVNVKLAVHMVTSGLLTVLYDSAASILLGMTPRHWVIGCRRFDLT
jgi:hypothetical protein